MSDLLRALKSGRVLLMDGAMGTELQRAGLRPSERPEDWNLSHPGKILAVHDAYIAAGAKVLLTNSFQANPAAFRARKNVRRELWIESFQAAVQIAAKASAFIAADIGPIISKGQEFHALDTAHVLNMAVAAQTYQADAILFETCSSARVRFAIRSATKVESPTMLSLTYRKSARGYETLDGHSPTWFAERAENWGVAALGVNCGLDIDVADCAAIARQYREVTRLPLFARPNAGTPKKVRHRWVYPRTPAMMAEQLPELLEAGVAMVGGCCGTTPAHIAAFRKVVDSWNRSH